MTMLPRRSLSLLVGTVVLAMLALACDKSPTAPNSSTPSTCNIAPNYKDSTLSDTGTPQLAKWRAFPILVFIDISAIPASLQQMSEPAARTGSELWAIRSGDRIGSVRFATSAWAKWDAGDYTEYYAKISFPSLLEAYASKAFNQLKHDQEALLRTLWPRNESTG
jgi:hypothetical protein